MIHARDGRWNRKEEAYETRYEISRARFKRDIQNRRRFCEEDGVSSTSKLVIALSDKYSDKYLVNSILACLVQCKRAKVAVLE